MACIALCYSKTMTKTVKKTNNGEGRTSSKLSLVVPGYILLTASIWTLPFALHEVIPDLLSPQSSSEAYWVYTFFVYSTIICGCLLLLARDIGKGKLVPIVIFKWLLLGLLTYVIFFWLHLALYWK